MQVIGSQVYEGFNFLDYYQRLQLLELLGDTGKHFISITLKRSIHSNDLVTYNDCYVKKIRDGFGSDVILIMNANGIIIGQNYLESISMYTYDDNDMTISSDGYKKPTKYRKGKSKGKSQQKKKSVKRSQKKKSVKRSQKNKSVKRSQKKKSVKRSQKKEVSKTKSTKKTSYVYQRQKKNEPRIKKKIQDIYPNTKIVELIGDSSWTW